MLDAPHAPDCCDASNFHSLVEIGEKQFLMPQHAEWIAMDRKGNQLRNVTEFSTYHKFSSDTKIDFEKQ